MLTEIRPESSEAEFGQDPKHEMTIAIEKYYKNLMKFIQFFCSMRRFFEVMKSSGFPFRIHLNGNFGNVPADFKFGSCDKFDIVIFNILVLTRFHQRSSDTNGNRSDTPVRKKSD